MRDSDIALSGVAIAVFLLGLIFGFLAGMGYEIYRWENCYLESDCSGYRSGKITLRMKDD